jgi:radical SAM protein with 4Fe4S-binding SPASM domain
MTAHPMSRWWSLGRRRLGQELREAAELRTGLPLSRPFAIRAHPTERCNYKCGSCACWRLDEYPAEMSLEQWQHAFTDLQHYVGRFTVQFAGGEPLLFKPLLDLVQWCSGRRIDWGMITNGSALTASNVARLVGAAPLNIDVSVDGASDAVHDASRGTPGSLARITQGLQRLRMARDAAGRHFPIRIKATVHRQNLHEMPALVDWAVRAGASSVDFSPVRPWTDEVTRELWLRPSDEARLTQVIASLQAAKRAGAPIETEERRMQSWIAHFRGDSVVPERTPCRVGLRDFHILANGDVRSCWEYPVIGNVTRQGVREIWTSAATRRQRAETLACSLLGSPRCATSCLSHRTIAQDWKRIVMLSPQPR